MIKTAAMYVFLWLGKKLFTGDDGCFVSMYCPDHDRENVHAITFSKTEPFIDWVTKYP